mmetsp:Transcript_31860/g.40945  ORF Transcript_31860/g.40945 Transcript_31860/m.40945 type:complete len:198 (+) Transcript_31860:207-800(+)
MTANIGANIIAEMPPDLTGSEPKVKEAIMEVVRGTLSPELLNRIDETVVFNRLQRQNMDRIAEIHLEEISKRLSEGQNMTLDVSDVALECIAEKGYDIRYGARPLKRVLAKTVLNPLSHLVLEGTVLEGDTVRVRARGEVNALAKSSPDISWISSNDGDDEDRNDILILRNHDATPADSDTWDDEDFLLEDGRHAHR